MSNELYQCPSCGFYQDYQDAWEITECPNCKQMIDWEYVQPRVAGELQVEIIQEEDGLYTGKVNGVVKAQGMTEKDVEDLWKLLIGRSNE